MTRKTKKKKGAGQKRDASSQTPIRTKLTPRQVARLTRIDEEYTASLKLPDYESLPEFLCVGSGLFPELDVDVLDARKGKKGRGRKKKQPKASPQVVYQEVQQALGKRKKAGWDGNLVLGELNFEFLTAQKANHFAKAYGVIVPLFHLIFCAEVDKAGVQAIAKANSYGWRVSKANNRNQAVAFLVHPRLEILSTREIHAVANVQGIPNLRPGLVLKLKDKVTDHEFTAVAVHLKSMRGGPKSTAPVRYQQCEELEKDLRSTDDCIIGGDWNCFLDNTTDTQPLITAGWKLLNPTDSTSTQTMGGRLDGFIYQKLGQGIGRYQVYNPWQNQKLGRTLTDHGVLSCRMSLCGLFPAGKGDAECSTGDNGTGSGDASKNVIPDIVVTD